jgi:transposase InsO family protein
MKGGESKLVTEQEAKGGENKGGDKNKNENKNKNKTKKENKTRTDTSEGDEEEKEPITVTVTDGKQIFRAMTTKAWVGGKQTNAFVDTGSSVSLISSTYAQAILGTSWRTSLEPWQGGSVNGAGGTRLQIHGTTRAPVLLAGSSRMVKFIVVEALICDALLGTDCLYEFKVTIDFKNETMKVHGRPCKINIKEGKEVKGERAVNLVVEKDIVIPARTAGYPVQLRVQGEDKSGGEEGVVSECMAHRHGRQDRVYVARGFGAIDKYGKRTVLVSNCHTTPIKLVTGRRLAQWNPGELVPEKGERTATAAATTQSATSTASAEPTQQEEQDFKAALEKIISQSRLSTPAGRERLRALLARHKKVFCDSLRDGGAASVPFPHSIKLKENAHPIKQRPHRLAPAEKELAREAVQKLLDGNMVSPSSSPWGAPIVLAKKTGTTEKRFCVDYRKLNDITIKDAYPMPRIDDTLDKLSRAQWFSVLDMASGYWQILLDPEDREKTAFVTDDGLFHWNVLPMGLSNAPATFQRNMDIILAGLTGVSALVYIDDVIVYSETEEQHFKDLDAVLTRIGAANLKVKISKCKLFRTELPYLGYIVSRDGIKVNPEKIDAVLKEPAPKNVSQLKRFLGMATYYRRFIKDFADIAEPLTRLMRATSKWEWGPEQQRAYEKLREKLTSAPVLAYPDFDRPFELHTDASDYAIGAVLAQRDAQGRERVIAYGSCTLTKEERNYTPAERECLSLVHFMKNWRPYLYGRRFTVKTDSTAVSWLRNTRDPFGRLARWCLQLLEYDFNIVHRPGKSNANADYCSRLRGSEVTAATGAAGEESEEFKRVREEQQKDSTLGPILEGMMKSGKYSTEQAPAWLERIRMREEVLWHVDEQGNQQLVIPKSMIERIIKAHHNDQAGGHYGTKRTYQRIAAKYWWPGMLTDVTRKTKECEACQKAKPRGGRTHRGLLQPSSAPRLWQRIAVDLITELPKSKRGNTVAAVFSEQFSKYKWAVGLPNKQSKSVVEAYIKQIVLPFGAPEELLSDRGGEFISDIMKEINQTLGVKKVTTTSHHPQTDGEVERFNKTLKEQLRARLGHDQTDWDQHLEYITAGYNAAIHPVTGETPFFLMFGRDFRLPLDQELLGQASTPASVEQRKSDLAGKLKTLHEDVKRRYNENAEKMKAAYDSSRTTEDKLKEGDLVLLERSRAPELGQRATLLPLWIGPYRIIERLGPVNVRIVHQNNPKDQQRVHVDRLKRFHYGKKDEQKATEPKKSDQPMSRPLAGRPSSIERIEPDGNCVFRALARAIYGDQNKHQQVRSEVVTYIKNHRSHFQPFLITATSGTWDNYINRISKTGTWGGDLEISAASACYGIDTFVWRTNTHGGIGEKVTDLTLELSDTKKRPEPRAIHLLFDEKKDHYDVLVEKSQNDQKITRVAEDIVDSRIGPGGRREFKVRWKGFTKKNDTWEQKMEEKAPELVARYLRHHRPPEEVEEEEDEDEDEEGEDDGGDLGLQDLFRIVPLAPPPAHWQPPQDPARWRPGQNQVTRHGRLSHAGPFIRDNYVGLVEARGRAYREEGDDVRRFRDGISGTR